MSSLLSCDVDPWSIVCPTVVVCFNFKFALIEFRLKRLLSFIRIALCPLRCLDCRFGTLTEFDTLAEFDKVAENSFGSLPMVQEYPSDPLRKISALQTKVKLAGNLSNKQNLAQNLANREIASWKKNFVHKHSLHFGVQINSGWKLHSDAITVKCLTAWPFVWKMVGSLFNIKIYLPANNSRLFCCHLWSEIGSVSRSLDAPFSHVQLYVNRWPGRWNSSWLSHST